LDLLQQEDHQVEQPELPEEPKEELLDKLKDKPEELPVQNSLFQEEHLALLHLPEELLEPKEELPEELLD